MSKQKTPMQAPRLKGWMTATEIAIELGVSRQTVNQMLWDGEFKTLHRVGPDSARPMYVVKTSEFEKIKATRNFPRSPRAVSVEVEEDTSAS